MVRYAREHGFDASGLHEWTMLVHDDGRVDFFDHYVPLPVTTTCDRGWSDRTPLADPPEPLDD